MSSEGDGRFLGTEANNKASRGIDVKPIPEIIDIILEVDKEVIKAVHDARKDISRVAEMCLKSVREGGRIIYVGAGTSGRIAVQDVVELYPTYGIGPETFLCLIAGGESALKQSIEGAEDDVSAAVREIRALGVKKLDIVIGISASGRTPYVIESIRHANNIGCTTIGITNNHGSDISKVATYTIRLATGPEVIQGSTRMKAGTSQKMVLNAISTAVAIKMNRVYGNMMSYMGVKFNSKLQKRAVNYLVEEFGLSEEESLETLKRNGFELWKAINELDDRRHSSRSR